MVVVLTQKAILRLNGIVEYFKSIGYVRYGIKTRAAVVKKAMRLKDFPMMGQSEESLSELNHGHRYLVEGHYKIIYRVEQQTIYVTDIFDTRQDPEKM